MVFFRRIFFGIGYFTLSRILVNLYLKKVLKSELEFTWSV